MKCHRTCRPARLRQSGARRLRPPRELAAIASIEAGLYHDALMKLQRDFLPKMDGCALTGQPNQDDWIITCEAQQKLYPLILEAIQLLQSLH